MFAAFVYTQLHAMKRSGRVILMVYQRQFYFDQPLIIRDNYNKSDKIWGFLQHLKHKNNSNNNKMLNQYKNVFLSLLFYTTNCISINNPGACFSVSPIFLGCRQEGSVNSVGISTLIKSQCLCSMH